MNSTLISYGLAISGMYPPPAVSGRRTYSTEPQQIQIWVTLLTSSDTMKCMFTKLQLNLIVLTRAVMSSLTVMWTGIALLCDGGTLPQDIPRITGSSYHVTEHVTQADHSLDTHCLIPATSYLGSHYTWTNLFSPPTTPFLTYTPNFIGRLVVCTLPPR